MTAFWEQVAQYLADTALAGVVMAVIALWMSHMRFKVHVAENYSTLKTIDKFDRDIADIQRTLTEILRTVHELKGRMDASPRD